MAFALRRVVRLGLGAVLLAFAAARGMAAPPLDPYTVTDVAVEAAQRDAALADAQRKALRQIVERMAGPAEAAKLHAGDQDVQQVVRSLEVQQEKIAPGRYAATVAVSFTPGALRRLLQQNNIAFVEMAAQPILVVPAWVPGTGPAPAWTDDTPWRRAWAARPARPGPLSYLLASAPAAASTPPAPAPGPDDAAGLLALARSQGAGRVLVATATPQGGAIHVTGQFVNEGRPPLDLVQPPIAGGPDATLAAAADRLAAAIEEQWRSEAAVPPDSAGSGRLEVRVPLQSFEDWLAVRRGLSNLAAVPAVILHSLDRHEAQLGLDYRGDPAQLKTLLAQRDLSLEQSGDSWILRRGAAP